MAEPAKNPSFGRTSSFRNAKAAIVQGADPEWTSPIDASRRAEILTCTRIVIDSLWPKLEEALSVQLLDARVQQYERAKKICSSSYKCVAVATIRSTFDSHEESSEIRGRLQPGEIIDVFEEKRNGRSAFVPYCLYIARCASIVCQTVGRTQRIHMLVRVAPLCAH